MDVNYEVWGTPETWVNGDTTQQLADIKFAASTNDTLGEAWTTGRVPWNTVDLSTTYWGISKDSMWAHPHQVWGWSEDGQTSDFEVGERELLTQAVNIPAIFTAAGTDTSCPISYTRRWKYRVLSEQSSIAGNAYSRKVFMDFNYQKVMIAPYVICKPADWYRSTSNISQSDNISFVDYFDNDGYINRPQILGFGYRCRFGDGNTTRAETTSFGLVDLLVDAPGSSGYESKAYFAGPDGSSFATHNIVGYSVIPQDISVFDEYGDGTVGDSDTGLRWAYSPTNTGTSVRFYYYDDNPLWEINKTVYVYNNRNSWAAYPRILCTATNKEAAKAYAMKQIAYLGLPFVIDPETAKTGKIGDIGVYLPKFDENGVTTGEYAEGTAALALPNAQWIDGRTGSGYDPYKPPTPSGEDDTGDLENSTYGNYGYTGGNKLYLLTQAEVDTFMSTINAYYTPASGDTPEDIQEKKDRLQLDFKGSNPFNYLVGLYALPIYVGYTDGATINLGPVDTGIAARLADPSSSRHFEFGTWKITPQFNDFRDYAPYTSIELYIPLCGSVQLDPADVMGHTIKVDALFDLQTGDLTARVLRDRLESGTSTQWTMIDTVQGNLFVSIPVTADDMGNFQNRQHYIKASMLSKAVNFLGGTANTVYNDAGSVAGAVAGTGGSPHLTSPFSFLTSGFNAGMGIGLGRYQLTHSPLTPYQVSTASSAIGFNMYPRAKIFIKRPKMLTGYSQSTYAHTVGNATCENTTVGNKTGLIVCSDVDLSGLQTANYSHPATLEEQRMIKQALTSGVYV